MKATYHFYATNDLKKPSFDGIPSECIFQKLVNRLGIISWAGIDILL